MLSQITSLCNLCFTTCCNIYHSFYIICGQENNEFNTSPVISTFVMIPVFTIPNTLLYDRHLSLFLFARPRFKAGTRDLFSKIKFASRCQETGLRQTCDLCPLQIAQELAQLKQEPSRLDKCLKKIKGYMESIPTQTLGHTDSTSDRRSSLQ